ncbi:MAG: L-threonine 3-dehydrogenase [bacterium]|nr:L-threonine 3-dehydrogenase [bacterium]
MKRILVTGSLGQIGSELVTALRGRPGVELVVASDIKMMPQSAANAAGPFEYLDCTNQRQVEQVVRKYGIDTIYHLAALLSAVAEERPQVAWDVNLGGLYRVLEVARQNKCSIFFPSSIGAFGPSTPRDETPQDTIQRPTTIYGVTKVAGELVCDYYHLRFGVDTRGVRFPGIISHVAIPGGGTTDYAVEIFYEATRNRRYTCFLEPDTRLDMMYMPDSIKAAIEVMEADAGRLAHRNAFNVTSMNFAPEDLAAEIKKHLPEFRIEYQVDPVRQAIADSWAGAIEDSAGRREWDWRPEHDIGSMTRDMLENLERKLRIAGPARDQG